MSEIGTNDVDIKLKQRANGLWEFDTDSDGDFVPITGSELCVQRLRERLLTRKRFYPIGTFKPLPGVFQVDEEGKYYVPGELENLGHPDFGSILSYYVAVNDSNYFRGMLYLDILDAINSESQLIAINSIDEIRIEKSDGYSIYIRLTLGNPPEEVILEEVI